MQKSFLRFFTKSFRLNWLHLSSDVAIPLVALLIVGTTLGWVIYDDYWQTQESEYRLLEAHARNADVQVASALGQIEHLLHQIIDEQLNGGIPQDKVLASRLNQYKNNLPELSMLLLTDAAGQVSAATDKRIVGRDISLEPYFLAHLDKNHAPKLFMSRPDNHLQGITTITFSLPIINANRQFSGIACVTIGFNFFPKVLQAINSQDSASMSVIFNRNGDVLYRRENPKKFFGFNIVKVSKVFQEHSASGTPLTRHIGPSYQNGKTRLFLVRDVGDTGLSLILSRQLDEVLAKWRRNVIIYTLIFLLTIVVVVYLAIAAARRKQLEDARNEALSRIQKIASQVTGVIFQFRLYRDGHYSMPFASDAAQELFRVNPEDIREDASKLLDIIHPDDYDTFIASIQNSARNLTHWHHEYRVKFDDGTIHWLLGNAMPQREMKGVVLWHGFITDITERKQMEEEIVAAKHRAEEANLAKSKFLAAASHDLRQPIHAQGLFLSVLARTQLSIYQRDVLTKATTASKASSTMLNALLDFSRIEAGAIKPKWQPFRLQPLLNKLEREFASLADEKGIAYRSRETDLIVQSDPMLVEFILRNLISNAIRYTDHGGVLVASRKRGGHAVLEVWDTGIGVAPEHQQEIFREFHQLGNPERDQRKGLGLGLAIVDGLARTLGHDLSLASTEHRGSVFRMALPIATTALPVEQASVELGSASMFNARVLVIDDDEAVRSGMLHLLGDWGCKCETAESIEDALAIVRIHTPDLVISDYRLREQRTGLEAIAALRELLGDNFPALLITGDTAPERLREAHASGIPLLHKPVSPSLLYSKLASMLPNGSI
jgi:PAS domain S-box-containing protein